MITIRGRKIVQIVEFKNSGPAGSSDVILEARTDECVVVQEVMVDVPA